MVKQDFLLLLDELFEEEPGTLGGQEPLQDIEMWDSLTALGFIAMVDEEFDMIISGNDIETCQTVDDLINLVAQHIEQ